LPSHSGGVTARATCHDDPLLDPSTLPELPPEPGRAELRRSPSATVLRATTNADRRRGEAYSHESSRTSLQLRLGGATLHSTTPPGHWGDGSLLVHSSRATSMTRWYDAATRNGLVADDGERQCWATIRSGLSVGLEQPVDANVSTHKDHR
jgi:hypothetical protein